MQTEQMVRLVAQTSPMTVPLWGLVVFILWAIAVVVALLAARLRHLAAGGNPKDFAVIDDNNLMWRLFRVQANLIENLPLYLGVVVLLVVRGVSGGAVDLLVAVYITFRLLHSLIHIAGADPRLRVLCLAVQFSCLVGLLGLVIVE